MKTRTSLIPLSVLALVAAGLLSACGQSGEPAGAPDGEPEPATSVTEAPAGDPVHADPYSVTLTFTPGAAAKLAGMGERVIVDNMFYGIAKEGAKDADEIGQIALGAKEIEVEAVDQTVSVSPPPFMPGPMSQIVEAEGARLLINVYSARKAHEDNLLSCGLYEDRVEAAPAAQIAIHCELIYPDGEPAPVEQAPAQ